MRCHFALQLEEAEHRLGVAQRERSLMSKEISSLKAELNRLRSQLDHTSDSQVIRPAAFWCSLPAKGQSRLVSSYNARLC